MVRPPNVSVRLQCTMSAASVDIQFKVTPAARRTPAGDRERILANPGFGKVFSEHMAVASWERGAGWHDALVCPYAPIPLDPFFRRVDPLAF